MTFTRAWLVDAAERVVRAFLVAFVGQMLASSTGLYSVGAAKAAAAAGIASALSVVLSLLGAANTGGSSPASMVGSHPAKAAPVKTTRRRKATGDKGFADAWLLVALLVIAALVLGAGVSWWFLLLLVLVVLVLVRG